MSQAIAAGGVRPTVASGETYNYKVVRQFAVMTVVWGIVGMLAGVWIAAAAAWALACWRGWLPITRCWAIWPQANSGSRWRLAMIRQLSRKSQAERRPTGCWP